MSAVSSKSATAAIVIMAAIALAGCAVSRMRMSDDYGQALRQDFVAQVADPDAHYKGLPAAGSDGHRVTLAVDRYNRNAVVPPVSTTTSSSGGGGGGSGGSSSSSPPME